MLKNLFKNIRWLLNNSLDGVVNKNNYQDMYDITERTLYYVPNSNVYRPNNILSPEETIDVIVNSNKSVARFGDGEILIMLKENNVFQCYDENLRKRLFEVFNYDGDNLFLCAPGTLFLRFLGTEDPFVLMNVPKWRSFLKNNLSQKKHYGETQFYLDYGVFEKLRSVWDGKNIILVGCPEALSKIQYDIYDNAKSIDYVFCRNRDCFSQYDWIVSEVKSAYKDGAIVILQAGMTGTVLAYDFMKLGMRALDLGHLQKAYDLYKKNLAVYEDPTFWDADV